MERSGHYKEVKMELKKAWNFGTANQKQEPLLIQTRRERPEKNNRRTTFKYRGNC